MLLQPRNRKYRKDQKGRRTSSHTCTYHGNRGHNQKALAGNLQAKSHTLAFGCYGLKSLEQSALKASQIEAVRRVLVRKARRIGKIWIRVFPYKPVTEKPTKTRMGKGKGSVAFWVCPINKGQILFELSGDMPPETAREIFKQAGQKLPLKTKIIDHEQRNLPPAMLVPSLKDEINNAIYPSLVPRYANK